MKCANFGYVSYFCWFGQNYLNLGAHLASLLQLGHLKSQGLEGVTEGLVNGCLGKILWFILLEWQQRLVVVSVDIADEQSWPSCLCSKGAFHGIEGLLRSCVAGRDYDYVHIGIPCARLDEGVVCPFTILQHVTPVFGPGPRLQVWVFPGHSSLRHLKVDFQIFHLRSVHVSADELHHVLLQPHEGGDLHAPALEEELDLRSPELLNHGDRETVAKARRLCIKPQLKLSLLDCSSHQFCHGENLLIGTCTTPQLAIHLALPFIIICQIRGFSTAALGQRGGRVDWPQKPLPPPLLDWFLLLLVTAFS